MPSWAALTRPATTPGVDAPGDDVFDVIAVDADLLARAGHHHPEQIVETNVQQRGERCPLAAEYRKSPISRRPPAFAPRL